MSFDFLAPFFPHGLDPSHHLLLGDQVIDALQQAEQALHAPTPLVQHLVSIPGLGEADDPGRTVDFRVHSLGGHELTDVGFSFVFVEIEKLRQTAHLNARVVFRYDADVVLNHSFAKVLPAGVSFGVSCAGGIGKDVGSAEVRAKILGHNGPAHEFREGEKLKELGFRGR